MGLRTKVFIFLLFGVYSNNIFSQITFIPSSLWVNKDEQYVSVLVIQNCSNLGQAYENLVNSFASISPTKINFPVYPGGGFSKEIRVHIPQNSTGNPRSSNIVITGCSNCLSECKDFFLPVHQSSDLSTNFFPTFAYNQTNPYPNPAAHTINLPYQLNSGEQTDMQIYDVNGKLIATKRIDVTFDKIVLNVSGYEKGMYVYKYNGKSAKFVVE